MASRPARRLGSGRACKARDDGQKEIVMKWPMIKWKSMTPEQLREVERWLLDRAGEMRSDRSGVAEEAGFDLVGGIRSLARRVGREAARKAK
jgi:hypothetical protein